MYVCLTVWVHVCVGGVYVFVCGCTHVYADALELPETDVGFPFFRQGQPWLSLNSLCSTCQAQTRRDGPASNSRVLELKAYGIMAGWLTCP